LFLSAGRFSIDAARFIMAEIICALEYVHSQNIVYRDLKPENVLLDAEGHIRLADFGLAKQHITSDGSNAGTKAQTFCGTPQYLAPEILSGQPYSKSVDYWSAGVLFYELLTGAVPFYSSNRQELYAQTIQGEISFPVYVAKEAQSLVRGILVRNPEDRLGSGVLGSLELKQHPFFRGTRWADIDNRSLEPPYKPKIVRCVTSL
jgi:serine/threonine protein kinase